VATQIFVIFTRNLGEDGIQSDNYFSKGLKTPSSYSMCFSIQLCFESSLKLKLFFHRRIVFRQWRFARSRCPQGFLGMERRGLGILWFLAENFIILLSEQWKITCCLGFFWGLLYYTVKRGLCNKWYSKDPVLKQPGFTTESIRPVFLTAQVVQTRSFACFFKRWRS